MANRKNRTASLLKMSEQAQKIVREFDAHLRNVLSENEADRICGSWIALGGNYCLSIRKSAEGYAAMLCDNTRLYKVIVREVTVWLANGTLLIPGLSDGQTPQTVSYFPRYERLRFGEYGVFESEEAVLRRTDSYRCEELFEPGEII